MVGADLAVGAAILGELVAFAPVPTLAQAAHWEQWRYEPKLDGFRGLLWRRRKAEVRLLSRNRKDLTPWFPELAQVGALLPPDTLVDGEIPIVDEKGASDFGGLQRRLGMGQRDRHVAAHRWPAVLLCFDVPLLEGLDLTTKPLRERRRRLKHLVVGQQPCLQLVTQTDDRRLAEEWLTLVPSVEGVVAKRADGSYTPGRQRDWLKVKRQRTPDCAVIGVWRPPVAEVGAGAAPR